MTAPLPIERLSDGELISEVKATEDLIYRIECFGTRDLVYLEFLYREVERRGLDVGVRSIWSASRRSDAHDELGG
jgi:hypothetical protein